MYVLIKDGFGFVKGGKGRNWSGLINWAGLVMDIYTPYIV